MDSNFPQDLLDLKNHINHWRLTRRFVSEALQAKLRKAIIQTLSSHPVSLIKKALKIDTSRFRTSSFNTSLVLHRPTDRFYCTYASGPAINR